jgi:signal peptidase II
VKRDYHLLIFTSAFVVLLDQITKYVITKQMALHSSIEVIKGFLNIVHIRNNGIAFGLLRDTGDTIISNILLITNIIIILALILWALTLKKRERLLSFALSLIIGGAIGNLIDRITLGEVVDFLDFYLSNHHWPAFNIADSSITVGTILLAIKYLLETLETLRG